MSVQTETMQRPTGSTISNLTRIISEQGVTALWRGNMANMYRNSSLILLRFTLFDRIKHYYAPLHPSQYADGTLDKWWRQLGAAVSIVGLSTAIVYPLDLIHTRISTELTPKTERRQYHTTFDCFNRTHVDEGFKTGLFKGW